MTATFGGPLSVEEFRQAGIEIKVIRQDLVQFKQISVENEFPIKGAL